jgi:hypothetical protein
MPFASRGGFLHQPPAAAAGRRTGAADTNSSVSWTAESGETTQTDQFKYGTASYYTAASGSEIHTTSTMPTFMNYGTGDFCLEWYMYIDSLSGQSASCEVMSNDVSGGFGFRLARSYNNSGLSSGANAKYINVFARGQADLERWDISTGSSGDSTWQTGKWYFCVLQRKSSNMAFWLDGVLKTVDGVGHATYTADTYNFASSISTSRIRWGAADQNNNGVSSIYFDEICWSNSWRYDDSGDISTLPSSAFTVDEYTSQLMHMDGADGGTTFTNATS